jgi:hypothetical protein
LAFEEGSFAVTGYVVQGKDNLSQLGSGDRLKQAKLVEGGDRLVVPSAKQ